MDESVMLTWIDKVLKPYIKTAHIGIHPVILLDHYRCHMMESVVNIIQDLGCAVEHIHEGCTGLAQPVDVGIGKPLKIECDAIGRTGCSPLVLPMLPKRQHPDSELHSGALIASMIWAPTSLKIVGITVNTPTFPLFKLKIRMNLDLKSHSNF